MCRPTHYTVCYEINPWMDSARPTATALAIEQWERLRSTYLDLGHTVELIDPLPGCPDMVYAANGATVVDGVAYAANFRYEQRRPEAPAYLKRLADLGFAPAAAEFVNEGEGDMLFTGTYVLAGTGFRSEPAAHRELQEAIGRPVITLELVNPRYYHLDTALAVLTGDLIAYYPPAFTPGSRAVLEHLFPDAIIAGEADAAVLGLNAVSDGEHVVVAPRATRLAAQFAERGLEPIPVDTSELLKGGGGAKCCTLELRR
ncbi:N-dimethylarginine dimethylaminohydrolase [Pseudactinotalea sp. HY160]|uniref:dimethylargininase n=1 Tax=Pseudactinotalea sp. HY160 TaxID=2654490 RepID=UPI00128D7903|nr:dimethylargininase [Pseudactinotalea sp. HY160]MPV48594.1 N-dimethylarginine dimethylaminohydrolase [Pseudactinotalea sp. HY160]